MYDHTTGLPCDHMTVQLYKVLLLTYAVNCTAGTPMPWLFSVVQWSVHWALNLTTQVLVLAGARRFALETCRKKKMLALLLGLAKSIYKPLVINYRRNLF